MVSGKVISKEKQEVVDFATVYLKGTTYGCTTNEEGIYHLHAPAGKYTLVVSAIGYKTIEKPVTLVHGERKYPYLQPIITQYFIDNKSEIWLLFLIAHSKR